MPPATKTAPAKSERVRIVKFIMGLDPWQKSYALSRCRFELFLAVTNVHKFQSNKGKLIV